MGKTYSHFVKRPIKNWNIEDRTFKQLELIEKKATVAPRHPNSHKYIDNIAKGKRKTFKFARYHCSNTPWYLSQAVLFEVQVL